MNYGNKNNIKIELGKNMFIVTTTLNTLIFKQVEPFITSHNSDSKQSSYKIINQFTLSL
jgi:hypothetical protein